jgi:hypothetical protein
MGGHGRVRTDGGRHQTAGHRTGGQQTAGRWTGGQQTADRRTLWTTTPGDRTADGWTAGSRTPNPEGWTPHGWTAATDAVAWLLAVSTTATTPDLSLPAGRSSGQTSSGRATTRTAQQQGRRGTHAATDGVWPPPRPSAAGGTPPSSWRPGALLSCVGFGWYEGRAMGQRKGEWVRGQAGEQCQWDAEFIWLECIRAGERRCRCGGRQGIGEGKRMSGRH